MLDAVGPRGRPRGPSRFRARRGPIPRVPVWPTGYRRVPCPCSTPCPCPCSPVCPCRASRDGPRAPCSTPCPCARAACPCARAGPLGPCSTPCPCCRAGPCPCSPVLDGPVCPCWHASGGVQLSTPCPCSPVPARRALDAVWPCPSRARRRTASCSRRFCPSTGPVPVLSTARAQRGPGRKGAVRPSTARNGRSGAFNKHLLQQASPDMLSLAQTCLHMSQHAQTWTDSHGHG